MTSPKKLDELLDRYLGWIAHVKRLSVRSQTLYRQHLTTLWFFCQEEQCPSQAVTQQQTRSWVRQLSLKEYSPKSIALILSIWRGYYAWLGKEGLISSNPCLDLRAPKARQALPKALTVDEAVQLANARLTAKTQWQESRDVLIVELLYGAGLRVSELTDLDVQFSQDARGWIDSESAAIQVLGKGEKRRLLPLGSFALIALKTWLIERSQLSKVFKETNALFIGLHGRRLSPTMVRQILKKRSLQAGLLQPVHPHMLRHSFASHILQSSGDLRAVQELLGHANIATTQIYTKLDFQHLAQVYDSAHPRSRRRKS